MYNWVPLHTVQKVKPENQSNFQFSYFPTFKKRLAKAQDIVVWLNIIILSFSRFFFNIQIAFCHILRAIKTPIKLLKTGTNRNSSGGVFIMNLAPLFIVGITFGFIMQITANKIRIKESFRNRLQISFEKL